MKVLTYNWENGTLDFMVLDDEGKEVLNKIKKGDEENGKDNKTEVIKKHF